MKSIQEHTHTNVRISGLLISAGMEMPLYTPLGAYGRALPVHLITLLPCLFCNVISPHMHKELRDVFRLEAHDFSLVPVFNITLLAVEERNDVKCVYE